MSAISFPLTTDISSATNQVSSQKPEQFPAGGGRSPTVRQPDTVTLSAVFPPPPPVDAANSVQLQLQSQGAAQSAIQAFPPAPAQTAYSQALPSPAASAATPTSLSQQEQLTQLDQVLEQLGINPQSISLDNRLALIKSANDPPALLNLVRTLGALNTSAATAQKIGALSANNANNLSNHDPAGIQTQTQAQNEPQVQPPTASTPPVQNSSPPAGPGFETSLQTNPGAASSSSQDASISNAAAQFQELQAVFQADANAQGTSGSDVAPSPSLSIRA